MMTDNTLSLLRAYDTVICMQKSYLY